jgi:hypothetical protein
MTVGWCLLNISAIDITLCRVFIVRAAFIYLHFDWAGSVENTIIRVCPRMSSILDSVAGAVVKHRNKV